MGYTVALDTANPPGDTLPAAWWRINPDTGETLGMGFNGEGAGASEYGIVVVKNALKGAVSAKTFRATLGCGGVAAIATLAYATQIGAIGYFIHPILGTTLSITVGGRGAAYIFTETFQMCISAVLF